MYQFNIIKMGLICIENNNLCSKRVFHILLKYFLNSNSIIKTVVE